MKYPKKSLVIDENRRITYSHPQVFGSISESSVLTTFEGERKQLIPVSMMFYNSMRALFLFVTSRSSDVVYLFHMYLSQFVRTNR